MLRHLQKRQLFYLGAISTFQSQMNPARIWLFDGLCRIMPRMLTVIRRPGGRAETFNSRFSIQKIEMEEEVLK
jgi:hypothetical protein